MKTSEALKLVGGLAKPSKMPGWAYGIPAAECKTGGILKMLKVRPVKVAMQKKAVMYFQLFRPLNTDD